MRTSELRREIVRGVLASFGAAAAGIALAWVFACAWGTQGDDGGAPAGDAAPAADVAHDAPRLEAPDVDAARAAPTSAGGQLGQPGLTVTPEAQ